MALRLTGFSTGRGRRRWPPLLVYRWDLDKTYLRTEFDTMRQLLRVPFEGPEDKVDVPGVVELIRAARERIQNWPPEVAPRLAATLGLDAVRVEVALEAELRTLLAGLTAAALEATGVTEHAA